jgi:segregation and condensation protein A
MSVPREKPEADTEVTGEVFDAGVERLTVAGQEARDPEALIVDIEGFEGPLDLLLVLARSQKVDLRKISILALTDQYLEFVAAARQVRLELAADYLVMAAWLTYMKSRLILPEPPSAEGEPTGEEMAARLAFQLQRLEAMRGVAARLMARDRFGREVFGRGDAEEVRLIRRPKFQAALYDLLKAYGDGRTRHVEVRYEVRKRTVYAIEAARGRIEAMLGGIPDWSSLYSLLPEAAPGRGEDRRTFIASTLSAALELVKEGDLLLRQEETFAPIFVRARPPEPVAANDAAPPSEDTTE